MNSGRIRKTIEAMVTPKPRRAPLAKKPRENHLAASLAASLALHAIILSLQFGVSGLGLYLLGMARTERRASVPTLQAILREQKPPSAVEVTPRPLMASENTVATIRVQPRKPAESQFRGQAVDPGVEPHIATGSLGPAKKIMAPPATKEKPAVPAEGPENSPVPVGDTGAPILATEKESSWSTSVAATSQDGEEKVRNEPIELEKANEAEALERARIEQAENQRKAELARVAKAAAEALERQRIEEGNRAAEQAALAKARLENLERLRVEEERKKTEQASLLKAREEALAKKVEAESAERTRQLAAQSEAAAESKRLQDDRGAGVSSAATGKADGRAAPQADTGSGLVRRALDQARSGAPGFPIAQPEPADRSRRGSILGRDPKDIQLAFYGDGWRQKIERIGSLNYPKISRNRHYDPLVVTVSINSDGSLAALRIDRSSGHKEIDDAVRRIVEMSAPFAAFPPDLKRSYDIVDITRTWTFLEERPRIYNQ